MNAFGAAATNSSSPVSPAEVVAFDRDGYHLLRPLFSPEEAAAWRERINRIFDLPAGEAGTRAIDGKTFTLADGVTINEAFWPIIFNERLLATVRSLIGDDIRYTQHSDLHINLPGGRWHRDSACRDFGVGPDWDEHEEPYRVVRIAIYLSQNADSGSSLVVLPGTHRRESTTLRREYQTWNRMRTILRRQGQNDLVPHWFFSGPRKVIRTQPGDCVIFDQRLLHAGGVVSGPLPKYAIYLSYGLDNRHSRNHRSFFLDRPTYNPTLPDGLAGQLAASGLLLAGDDQTGHN
jgi:hypothetical protein